MNWVLNLQRGLPLMYSRQAENGVWQVRDFNNIHFMLLLLICLHVPQSIIEIMNILDPNPLVDLLSVLRHNNDYGYSGRIHHRTQSN